MPPRTCCETRAFVALLVVENLAVAVLGQRARHYRLQSAIASELSYGPCAYRFNGAWVESRG